MGYKLIEGFEGGDASDWTLANGAAVISSAGLDMDGNYSLSLNSVGYTEYATKVIDALSEGYISLRWRVSGFFFLNGGIGVMSDGQNLISIGVLNGIFKAYRNTTLIASGTVDITINTTYLLEMYVKIDDTVGEVKLWINGILDIDFTGNTKPGAETTFNKIIAGKIGSDLSYSKLYIDNVIVSDSYIGEKFIQTIIPTGTGNSDEFTPSAGDNWECVDDIPGSEDDYCETNTPDAVCTFEMSNLTGDIGAVHGVSVSALAKIEGETAVPKLQLVIRSDGNDYVSDSKDVPFITATVVSEVWSEDPAGGSLTEAIVNGFEIGFKAKAS